MVLFEDVVLGRAPQPARVQALVLGVGEDEGHDDYCRGVDRQGHRDLVEVDAVVELPDVLDRIDRDPEPPDLALGVGVVAVQPHEGGQVEGRAQTGLALLEQEAEPGVGLAGRAEPGELPHGP